MNISLVTDGQGKAHIQYDGQWFDDMPSLYKHLTKTGGTLILHNETPIKGETLSAAQLIWYAAEMQQQALQLKPRVLKELRRRKK